MTSPLAFPPRLKFSQTPSPLQPLDRISEIFGGPRKWAERDALTGCLLTGNKVRTTMIKNKKIRLWKPC